GPLHQAAAERRHQFFFLYSTSVFPVSAFSAMSVVARSAPHSILPVWKTCLPCSRWTSTLIVYVPFGSGLPLSSLPSHTTVHLPGARVARLFALISALSSFAIFPHPDSVGTHRGLLPHTATVRTALPSPSSTHTATYGRRMRRPVVGFGSSSATDT